jgi:hypothetical protein
VRCLHNLVPTTTAIILLVAISGAAYIMRKKYEELREDWECHDPIPGSMIAT